MCQLYQKKEIIYMECQSHNESKLDDTTTFLFKSCGNKTCDCKRAIIYGFERNIDILYKMMDHYSSKIACCNLAFR